MLPSPPHPPKGKPQIGSSMDAATVCIIQKTSNLLVSPLFQGKYTFDSGAFFKIENPFSTVSSVLSAINLSIFFLNRTLRQGDRVVLSNFRYITHFLDAYQLFVEMHQ